MTVIEDPIIMDADVYQRMAKRSLKQLDHRDTLLMTALGVASEAGEITEAIKQHLYHGHNLDVENLKKELGDLCWYIAILADEMGWDLSVVLGRNIEKLLNRYPSGFTDEASRNRDVTKE